MKTKSIPIAALFAATAVSLLSAGSILAHPGHNHENITVVKVKARTLSNKDLAAADKAATQGTISDDKKTLTFTGKVINLVVHTGPEDDMLSYRIVGLKNPELVVPSGAMLNVLFVNDDTDMKHNLRFTADKAPFADQPDPKQSVGTPDIKPQTKTAKYGEEMTLRTDHVGTFTYVCTIKGHAKGGMYGTLSVH